MAKILACTGIILFGVISYVGLFWVVPFAEGVELWGILIIHALFGIFVLAAFGVGYLLEDHK